MTVELYSQDSIFNAGLTSVQAITQLIDPIQDTDLATKYYVDHALDVLQTDPRFNTKAIPLTAVPIATDKVLGGITVGNGLTVDLSGSLSMRPLFFLPLSGGTVTGPFQVTNSLLLPNRQVIKSDTTIITSLPIATSAIPGMMVKGDGLTIDTQGKISVIPFNGLQLSGGNIAGNLTVYGTLSSTDLRGTISNLPTASDLKFGCVRIGANLFLDNENKLNAHSPYVLTPATSNSLGGVKIGNGIIVDPNGTISTSALSITGGVISGDLTVTGSVFTTNVVSRSNYVLPKATNNVLGGVRIGSNLSIDANGVLSSSFSMTPATKTSLGGVMIGNSLSAAPDGTLDLANTYLNISGGTVTNNLTILGTLSASKVAGALTAVPIATTNNLGGVVVGNGLSVNSQGLLSVNQSQTFDTVPLGAIVYFAAAQIPDGFLDCSGQSLNKAQYADLYAVIGTLYGTVDSQHFNLPDLRGEFIRGWDSGRGVDALRAFGSKQGDSVQSHNHYLPTGTGTAGTTWTLADNLWTQSVVNSQPRTNYDATTYPNTSYDGPTAIGSVGTFAAETRPRNLALVACIKAIHTVVGTTQLLNFINKPTTANPGDILTFNSTSNTWVAANSANIAMSIATAQHVGGVQVGSGLTITSQGLLSVNVSELNVITKPQTANNGDVLTFNSSTSSWVSTHLPSPSATPLATQTSPGIITVGTGLKISGQGSLSVDIGANVYDTVPIGTVSYFAAQTPPTGFLVCDGSSLSISQYPDLFAVIGTAHGSVDNLHFNLPDLRGEFIRGWDAGKGTDPNRGFGSKQRGTIVSGYDDNDVGADIGFLPARGFGGTGQDYSSDPVTNATIAQYGITKILWSSTPNRVEYPASQAANWLSITRPRNIALLPCIKATKTVTGTTNNLNFIPNPANVKPGSILGYDNSTNTWVGVTSTSQTPIATTQILGSIVVGNGLRVTPQGLLSVDATAFNYISKPGNANNGDILSFNSSTNTWVAVATAVTNLATTQSAGSVIIGSGLKVSQGVVSVDNLTAYDSVPIGTVSYFAAQTPPTGFLECAGQSLSRSQYSDLFAVIGTTHGSVDNLHFNLPDLRGEFIRGWDHERGIDVNRTLGTWQKGTFFAYEVNSDGVWVTATRPGIVGPNSLSAVGVDKYNISDYPLIQSTGAQMTKSGPLPDANTDNAFNSGIMRPRNVALLPCIKATNTVTGTASNLNFIPKPALAGAGDILTYNTTLNTWNPTASSLISIQPATTIRNGSVRIGYGLSITTDGLLTVNTATLNYIPKPALPSSGDVLTYDDNSRTWVASPPVIPSGGAVVTPPATTTTPGAVVVGNGLKVTANGLLSVDTLQFDTVPIGTVSYFAAQIPPKGFLECNGKSIDRTLYSDLFAVIGTTYGSTDAQSFNLPDLRGEFVRGWDHDRGIDVNRTLGSNQKGSVIAANEISSDHEVYNPGTTSYSKTDYSVTLNKLGYDSIKASDYPDVVLNYANSGAPPAPLGGYLWSVGATRPHNVALLPCIKAVRTATGTTTLLNFIPKPATANPGDLLSFDNATNSWVSKPSPTQITEGTFGTLAATTGYTSLPNGIIMQWGIFRTGMYRTSTKADVVFPKPFPNNCFSFVASMGVATTDYDYHPTYRTDREYVSYGVPTKTGVEGQVFIDTNTGNDRVVQWYAVGN